MSEYKWRWMKMGRMSQVRLENGDDLANLASLDKKHWLAISMPVKGVRFDQRMLQLMDADGDGRIRTPEVIAAIDFLKAKGVDFNDLFKPSEADEAKLLASQLAKAEVTIPVKVGEGGKLFGSVSGKDVADALKKTHGVEIDKRKISLSTDVTGVGDYEAVIRLHPEATATVAVHVTEG